jgi:beta-glucuronidase
MFSRRKFLKTTQSAALSALVAAPLTATADVAAAALTPSALTQSLSLDGDWLFHTDSSNVGTDQGWYKVDAPTTDWRRVSVPHTWQIEPLLTEFRGVAWYRRTFNVDDQWRLAAVRIEFEAVFHSAQCWVNDALVGEHIGKAYTAFQFDLDKVLRWDRPNTIAMRVDNSFSEHMLPRGRSSDWAHDGGIYRPVQLLISPKTFIERVDVDAWPDLTTGEAKLEIAAFVRNMQSTEWTGALTVRVIEDATGLAVLTTSNTENITVSGDSSLVRKLTASFADAKLWHFDHPHLYRLEVSISGKGEVRHQFNTTFGVRKLEVKDTAFVLNGERVRLMGVERMAGSNPEFGMAEPAAWIAHDHDDLKNLNCIFTRVHWQQDKRVLDYCDRHGILIQTEVPTWGPKTFEGMGEQPDADLMQNGLDQLREMIARDRNHPSIVAWGLCNEIGGQNRAAYNFAKNMLQEAKRLDPNRLCSYASHSLRETPDKDVSGLMDFIECNEYYGSWYPGDASAMGRNMDLRTKDYIGGLIFFCYNDYRTHIGDRGAGVMRQRVHGVVNLYGVAKASYESLRNESSPIESVAVDGHPDAFEVTVRTRNTVPSYTLRGYKLRGVYYGYGEIPIERKEVELPNLTPGESSVLKVAFADALPWRVQFDVLRPTGFSAFTLQWKA